MTIGFPAELHDEATVVFIGPALTGVALDSDRLLLEGYALAQERLSAAMARSECGMDVRPSTTGHRGHAFHASRAQQ